MLALRQQPRQRDLGGRRVVALGDRLDPLDEREVRVHRLRLEARVVLAEVARRELLGLELAGQEAAAERRERQERRVVRGAPRARPPRTRRASTATPRTARRRPGGSRARVRAPRRSPRTGRARPPCPASTCSAIAPHVSSTRHVGIDAVQLVEVDEVGLQPPQRAVDRLAHVLRAARCAESTYSPASSTTSPHFVARNDLVAAVRDARVPTSSSLVYGPYMSAVSSSVTPSSSARWIVAIDSASSRSAARRRPRSCPCSRGRCVRCVQWAAGYACVVGTSSTWARFTCAGRVAT